MNKILVVDDSSENAEKIIDFLYATGQNYTCYQALNGQIASAIAEKKQPDLIITDWDMPEMDGIALIKHLKTMESTKDIPIIMCTGVMTKTENLKTALDAGAVDYIRKPVEKLELIARVHSMLKLSESMKKIKEQNSQLTDLIATKDKFFSIIAHDLKGPFSGILGLSELLMNAKYELSKEETSNFLKLINDSTVNAYRLLENLLEWARSQTGRINFNPSTFDVKKAVANILNLSVNASQAKQITVTHHIPEDLQLSADANMFNTILRNLISNAIKFTHKEGSVTVSAIQKNGEIEFTVSDTGVGMSEAKISKLFKINEKVTSLGTESETGTGLGLLLCKEFVERHAGKIWVESEESKGSNFKFTFPINV